MVCDKDGSAKMWIGVNNEVKSWGNQFFFLLREYYHKDGWSKADIRRESTKQNMLSMKKKIFKHLKISVLLLRKIF